MSTLHLINKSPFEKDAFDSCLRHALPGSAVLLIEDGIYGALRGTAPGDCLEQATEQQRYVLVEDLRARGFGPEALVTGVQLVDYDGFVDLAVAHEPVQSWL